jgi:transcriptional regulator with XRE-family HTH domain/tetratricopeptide (TPR) repeat protein
MARRYRLAKRRKAIGHSQEELAACLGVDRSTIGRWEAGETEPLPWLRPRLARALHIHLDHLDDLLRDSLSTRPEPGISPNGAHPLDEAGTDTKHAGSSAAVGPTAPRDGLMQSTDPALPQIQVSVLRQMSQTVDLARAHDEGEVAAFFAGRLDECQVQDGAQGPVRALPSAVSVVAALDVVARQAGGSVRSRLLGLAARGAEFVGWLYRDAGDVDQATYWYDRAIEWAQEAHHPAMQGYVLLRKSQMAYDRRSAGRVLTLAQAAEYGPWQLPDRIRAEVAQMHALGLAMAGATPDVVERKLSEAWESLALAVPDDEGSLLLGAMFDASTLRMRSASCYVEAGQASLAAELLSEVIAARTLSRRDLGWFSARRATALALAGEPDEAAAIALTSLDIAADVNSRRTKGLLAEILDHLDPWRDRPSVSALRESLGA